jgi:hypothetical protein
MNRSEDIVRQYGQSVFTIICQLVGISASAAALTASSSIVSVCSTGRRR